MFLWKIKKMELDIYLTVITLLIGALVENYIKRKACNFGKKSQA